MNTVIAAKPLLFSALRVNVYKGSTTVDLLSGKHPDYEAGGYVYNGEVLQKYDADIAKASTRLGQGIEPGEGMLPVMLQRLLRPFIHDIPDRARRKINYTLGFPRYADLKHGIRIWTGAWLKDPLDANSQPEPLDEKEPEDWV